MARVALANASTVRSSSTGPWARLGNITSYGPGAMATPSDSKPRITGGKGRWRLKRGLRRSRGLGRHRKNIPISGPATGIWISRPRSLRG